MTDPDRQSRSASLAKSDPTSRPSSSTLPETQGNKKIDRSPLPLTDRSNRLASPASTSERRSPLETLQTFRTPSSSAIQNPEKYARESSDSSPIKTSSRAKDLRSVSAKDQDSPSTSIGATSTPLSGSRNDDNARPTGLVSSFQRATSVSPSNFQGSTKESHDPVLTSSKRRQLKERSDQYRGVSEQQEEITPLDRGRSAGGLSNAATIGSSSSRNTNSDVASTSSFWSTHRPPSLHPLGIPLSSRRSRPINNPTYPQRGSSSERRIPSSSANIMDSGGSDDLVLLTQRLKLGEGARSSRSSSVYPVEDLSQRHGTVAGTPPNLYQQHPSLSQSQSTTTPNLPHPILSGEQLSALPTDTSTDSNLGPQRDSYSAPLLWQGHGPMNPLHQDSHIAASVPYQTPYGLSMQPTSLPGQTSPQSPMYGGGHQHQLSSDSAIFMYPGPYHQAVPSMTGQSIPQMMGTHSRSGSLSGPGGMSPLAPGMVPSLASGGYMMQQMHHYGPQSPVLVPVSDVGRVHVQGVDRRDPSSNNMIPSGMPMAHQTYGMTQTWIQPQSGLPAGTYALPQPWSGQYEARSPQSISSSISTRSGHQRVLSNQSNYRISGMGYMPGSMSPPSSSFMRSSTSGRMRVHSRSPSSFSQFSHPRSSTSDTHRSPLLNDFRSKHNRGRQYDLGDVKGSLVEFSTDQYGSRFIQEKLDLADPDDVKQVFEELLPSALTLMTDVFGNYVIQKLLEHGTDAMRSQLVKRMTNHVLMLSLGTYGCRVVQKALEHVSNEEQLHLINELRLDILTCARDQNANHVIQKTLEQVKPTTQIDFIPAAFRNNVYNLASHCYSCRVLQRIFEHCEESQRRPLIDELLRDAERLMHDQFGNYVVQWILQYGVKSDREVVIDLAKGNVMRLSRHKFASNVMEQVVRAASQEDRYALIQEALEPVPEMTSIELQPGVVLMMKDQYANYVLQRFLELSEGMQKMRLYSVVKPALQNLKRFSTGYAKHLAAIERLLESNIARSNVATMTSEAALQSTGV